MNVGVQIFLPDPAFNSFRESPESGIAGSRGILSHLFRSDLASGFQGVKSLEETGHVTLNRSLSFSENRSKGDSC